MLCLAVRVVDAPYIGAKTCSECIRIKTVKNRFTSHVCRLRPHEIFSLAKLSKILYSNRERRRYDKRLQYTNI